MTTPPAPTAAARPRRTTASSAAAVLLTLLMALLSVQVGTASPAAAATPVTYQGATYPAGGSAATGDKPQSKLWYNDGAWWALMRVAAGITIHRLESDHTWRNTGTVVDERIASTGDALWEDGKLYVGSRVSGGAMRAIRFSYNAATDTYTRDFSQNIAANGTESMSITRDSLNRLWVSYTQGSRVYVAHTTTSDTVWTAPFLVPVSDNTVTSDDISTLIAFNGRVGVMWSDQQNDVIRFAVHEDSAPDSQWTLEDALSGTNLADDHVNLKALTMDAQGRVYAVVKTSRGDAGEPTTDPSIVVLQRSGAGTGTWTSAVASRVGDKLTRPQIVLDSTNSRLYVLMATESGGTVYAKSAPLGALSFPTGKGTPFVQWPGASINDPTTTKDPVTAATGLVVLASDHDTRRYYHGELSLGGVSPAPDSTPPTAPAQLTATATASTSVALSWGAATDNVGVTGYRVLRDGTQVGTTAGTTYTDTGLAASTSYTYTVTAVDAAGNVSPPSAPATATTPAGGTQTPSAITFVSAATATGSTATTAVPSPAGLQAGDVLVAAVSVRGAPTITAPAGWTLVRTDSNGTTMRQAVYVRTLTSADGSSTWQLSSAKDTVVQVLGYRGVDGTSPVIASAGAVGTTASIPAPAVTAVSGARVVSVAGIARTSALAPASPLVERSEITTASTAAYKVSADAADTVAGGTTAGPWTTTANGSSGNIGQTLSLRPGA